MSILACKTGTSPNVKEHRETALPAAYFLTFLVNTHPVKIYSRCRIRTKAVRARTLRIIRLILKNKLLRRCGRQRLQAHLLIVVPESNRASGPERSEHMPASKLPCRSTATRIRIIRIMRMPARQPAKPLHRVYLTTIRPVWAGSPECGPVSDHTVNRCQVYVTLNKRIRRDRRTGRNYQSPLAKCGNTDTESVATNRDNSRRARLRYPVTHALRDKVMTVRLNVTSWRSRIASNSTRRRMMPVGLSRN